MTEGTDVFGRARLPIFNTHYISRKKEKKKLERLGNERKSPLCKNDAMRISAFRFRLIGDRNYAQQCTTELEITERVTKYVKRLFDSDKDNGGLSRGNVRAIFPSTSFPLRYDENSPLSPPLPSFRRSRILVTTRVSPELNVILHITAGPHLSVRSWDRKQTPEWGGIVSELIP